MNPICERYCARWPITHPSSTLPALVGPAYAPGEGDAGALRTYRLPVSSSYLRVPFALPWAARRLRLDALHVQYNAPPWCPCSYVTSVHDLCWERHPEFLPARDRVRLQRLMPGTVRRAAQVFVLTHAMKKEIAGAYAVPEDHFTVVSPSIDAHFAPVTDAARLDAVRAKYGLPPRYALYVGALQPRKNLARLAAAFARLLDRGLDHRLVVVGRRAWLYGEMLAQIDALNLGDRLMFTGYVDASDLPALYSAADLFAYVSLYEGLRNSRPGSAGLWARPRWCRTTRQFARSPAARRWSAIRLMSTVSRRDWRAGWRTKRYGPGYDWKDRGGRRPIRTWPWRAPRWTGIAAPAHESRLRVRARRSPFLAVQAGKRPLIPRPYRESRIGVGHRELVIDELRHEQDEHKGPGATE